MSAAMIPAAPAHLPPKVQANWKKTYGEALKQGAVDAPGNESAQRSFALRAANVHVKVAEPTNYAEAKKMVDDFTEGTEDGWKVIAHGIRVLRGVRHLRIVTANGHKYSFPEPPAKPAAPAQPTK